MSDATSVPADDPKSWRESAAYERYCDELVASFPPWTTEEIDQIIAELRAG